MRSLLIVLGLLAASACAPAHVHTRLENGVTVRYCDLHGTCTP